LWTLQNHISVGQYKCLLCLLLAILTCRWSQISAQCLMTAALSSFQWCWKNVTMADQIQFWQLVNNLTTFDNNCTDKNYEHKLNLILTNTSEAHKITDRSKRLQISPLKTENDAEHIKMKHFSEQPTISSLDLLLSSPAATESYAAFLSLCCTPRSCQIIIVYIKRKSLKRQNRSHEVMHRCWWQRGTCASKFTCSTQCHTNLLWLTDWIQSMNTSYNEPD